ncbi:UPF0481-like protein [Cinnamomum micranthum f. kanehirae]|uniref:UPF0481-like protein n=1 Tax=Cinnamomum micranthum f. kanehirae TaxID=337451 RepID=A0A443NAD2_9MAGN|nr:UPF0481-like protein [Cinnamomum micranthum f. kanehirae]
MTTGTRDDVRIQISEETENLGWLYKIIEEPGPRRTSKPLVQTVAQTLRGISRNKTCFDPSVVSFGPYHRDKPHLKPMERYKEVTALWFIKPSDNPVKAITREEAKQVYDEFVAKVPSVSSLRGCYTDKFVRTINDAEFMHMMFLDGCFMLYFIRLFLDQSSDLLETSHLNRPLILRDMFLLENQIPYSVLVALKSLKPSLMPGRGDDWAASFFKTVFLPPPPSVVSYSLPLVLTLLFLICTFLPVLFIIFWIYCCLRIYCCRCSADSRSEEGTKLQTEPLHLLDLLRYELTGKGVDHSVHGTGYWNYNFRPIGELKEEGIQVSVSNSESLSLNNIKLKKGWIDSYLELPRIVIDDSTKTRLLNLAAYEMCPDGSLGKAVITSYICFLDSLIYNADDVKELRSSNIMLNRLGSDEEVVNLVRELATNLSPDFKVYSDVIQGMEGHRKRQFNHVRLWISQFKRTHFTSPWTAISLIAAISVILLTLVQTIYSVLSYYKSK